MAATKSDKGSITSDLHALLISGKGADVTFVAGHSQLPAHSFILAARSPVFAAMFQNDMQEASSRRIQITDMDQATLQQLLFFMYTDTAPQLKSVAAELLVAADKYDLPLLKSMCERQISRGLSVDNAADTAILAELHDCPELRSATVSFIANHLEVLATDGWERLLCKNTATAVQISKQLATVQSRSVPPIPITLRFASEEDE